MFEETWSVRSPHQGGVRCLSDLGAEQDEREGERALARLENKRVNLALFLASDVVAPPMCLLFRTDFGARKTFFPLQLGTHASKDLFDQAQEAFEAEKSARECSSKRDKSREILRCACQAV